MGYWYVTDVSSLGAGNFITCRGHIVHLQNKNHTLHTFTCVAGIHGDSRKQLSCMGYNFMTLSRFIYPLTLFATAFCCLVLCDSPNAKRTENSYCRTCHVQVFCCSKHNIELYFVPVDSCVRFKRRANCIILIIAQRISLCFGGTNSRVSYMTGRRAKYSSYNACMSVR